MRLNKLLAQRLGVSRRFADELIAKGRVKVAGKDAKLGLDIPPEEIENVSLDGENIPPSQDFIYIMLNKPIGYVCSRDGQGSKTVYDLLPTECKMLNSVGRLDKNSSGLLLMSSDGNFINDMAHPSHDKQKIYEVTLDKSLRLQDKKAIESGGVMLADGVSMFPVKYLCRDKPCNKIETTLKEGRNRQVRRTFEAIGYQVITLHRTSFGKYKLGDLAEGQIKTIGK